MNDKIEIVRCLREGKDCEEHRVIINREFNESHSYLLNKEYSMSILALKSAYYKTHELKESSCINCAEMFRSTITESLECIHNDLHRMTNGFLRTNRFQSSYELAGIVLKEMKKQI